MLTFWNFPWTTADFFYGPNQTSRSTSGFVLPVAEIDFDLPSVEESIHISLHVATYNHVKQRPTNTFSVATFLQTPEALHPQSLVHARLSFEQIQLLQPPVLHEQ